MKRWSILACALIAVLAWGGVAQGGVKSGVSLNFYRATVSQAKYQKLLAQDLDIAAAKTTASGRTRLDLVLTRRQASALRTKGIARAAAPELDGPDRATGRRCSVARAVSTSGETTTGPTGSARTCTDLARRNPQLVKLEVIGHTEKGREIIALKVTQARERDPGRDEAGCALQRDPARARVDRARGRPAFPPVPRRQVAGERQADQEHAEDARALVRARLQPGRLSVHLPEPRYAPLAEEPPRSERRAGCPGRRRRRPEPQLQGALELRRRGLVGRAVERHLSRPVGRVRARDPGDRGPLRPHRLPLPGQLPLLRAVAPLPAGLADRDAYGRRPDLLRARRATRTTPRSTASLRGSRRTSST